MALRLKTTVIGKSPQTNNLTLITFQGSVVNPAATIQLQLSSTLAASFSLNQACNFYISLNGTEVTEIETAVGLTTTPASTQD